MSEPRPIWSVRFEPETIYDYSSLTSGLYTSHSAIDKAVKSGLLAYVRVGSRTLFFGSAIIAWLSGAQKYHEKQEAP